MNIPTVESQQMILPKIDLSGITSKQREVVRNVIREEWEVFSKREREIMMWEKIEPIQWKQTWKTATQCNLIIIQCHETYIMNYKCTLKIY